MLSKEESLRVEKSLLHKMLPSKYRLTGSDLIDLKKTGDLKSRKYLGILAKLNNVGHPRVSVIVSTKVSKKAVVRNKIKRIVKDCFRDNLISLGSYDILVLVKSAIVGKEKELIKNDLVSVLETIRS